MTEDSFAEFFREGTSFGPHPYQCRLATGTEEGKTREGVPCESRLIHVPTGAGKTEAVILAWLWNRVHLERQEWPRRLVYCLPMRVLVEQTRDRTVLILHRLGLLAGKIEVDGESGKERVKFYEPDFKDDGKIPVVVLMGGEVDDDWDRYPERNAILIGTQDMLLSRALNRGYGMTPYRWPMDFAWLNNDCLWVFDEIQLMGAGLATTSQLEAFRSLLGTKDGHGCHSVWMSATLQRDWLRTVDFPPESLGEPLRLEEDDYMNKKVNLWFEAKKPLKKAEAAMGESDGLAEEIVAAHEMHKGLTLIVVNTVARAGDLYSDIKRLRAGTTGKAARRKKTGQRPTLNPDVRLVLLHSRFRLRDRAARIQELLADPPIEGTICVSTQVVEAGVDVSATTLFTELAPWASLVQRFGRCNRKGTENDKARVFLIDMPTAKVADVAPPYESEQLDEARELLEKCKNGVGPSGLPDVNLSYHHTHVIRRKDLVDLFDTTSDLAGNHIEIDRFVREVEDSDVRVFWRDWPQPKGWKDPPENEGPRREELCPAPIGEFRTFAKAKEHRDKVRRWSFRPGKWEKADDVKIAPGQVFLIHADAGGYSYERGWDAESKARVEPVAAPNEERADAQDANEEDAPSHLRVWQTIANHTDEVCSEIDAIANALPQVAVHVDALREAARWHDLGKAHNVFQNAIDDGQAVERKGRTIPRRERPEEWRGCRFIAKAPGKQKTASGRIADPGFWRRYDWLAKEGRKHFRHELASALAVLDPRNEEIADNSRDLIAYLVAAHHGKVRLSIRSLPEERRPEPRHDGSGEERRFARGVWDGDVLPPTDLGGGFTPPAVTLSLEPMELGLCEREPFAGHPSWAERMIRLRDTHGPFRLAYLEALLRAADWRASAATVARDGSSPKEATHA